MIDPKEHKQPQQWEDVEGDSDLADLDENAFRDKASWAEDIGPEDMPLEKKMENLHEYGFDLMGEDDFVSQPVMPSDMPDWTEDNKDDLFNPANRGIGERIEHTDSDNGSFRPVEDAIIDGKTGVYDDTIYQETETFKDEDDDNEAFEP